MLAAWVVCSVNVPDISLDGPRVESSVLLLPGHLVSHVNCRWIETIAEDDVIALDLTAINVHPVRNWPRSSRTAEDSPFRGSHYHP